MKEIFIRRFGNHKDIVLVENGIVVENYEEDDSKERHEGKIYIGIVKDVLQGMQSAFVDIGEDKNTFIHLKDILPKVNVVKNNKTIPSDENIKKIVHMGDKILVQVKRDSTNIKGAKVSTHISIPSKFFVLMPDTDIRTISQRIEKEEEKQRLNKIVDEILPENFGVIIRTAALNKSKEQLKKDLEEGVKIWSDIQEQLKNNKSNKPTLLYKGQTFIEKLFVDLVDYDVSKIVVNDSKDYDEIKKIILEMEENIKVELKDENIFKIYDIEEQIEKSKQRKIWLKCGGYITIDKTEALTAIDVNSGKYTGNISLEQTVFKVNKEASIEITKQLRLRDIGGIIIIDYINMKNEEHKQEILEILEENLKKDRSKTQIIGFSKLNLLEMTRKHMKGGD